MKFMKKFIIILSSTIFLLSVSLFILHGYNTAKRFNTSTSSILSIYDKKTIIDMSQFFDIYPEAGIDREIIKKMCDHNDGILLKKGWHSPDIGFGTWMEGTESTLIFNNENFDNGYLILELLSNKKENFNQVVTVYLNDKYLGKRRVHDHLHSIAFNTKDQLIRGNNALRLETLFSERPPESDDQRNLSIMLRKLKLHSPGSVYNNLTNKIMIKPETSIRYTVFANSDMFFSYTLNTDHKNPLILYLCPLYDQSECREIIMPNSIGNHKIQIFEDNGYYGSYRFIINNPGDKSIMIKEPRLIIHEKSDFSDKGSHRPLFFAFYYPWYIPEERDIFTINPLYDDYSFSREQFEWEVETAKAYNIDGFCVEFFGMSDRDAIERYKIILEVAEEKDFKIIFFLDGITIYHRFLRSVFERTIAVNSPISPTIIEMNLLKDEASFIPLAYNYSSYYKPDNNPLVYVYAIGSTWNVINEHHWILSNLFSILGINISITADIGATSIRGIYNIMPYINSFTFYTAHDEPKLVYGPEYDTFDIFKALLKIYERYHSVSKISGRETSFYPVIFNGYDDRFVNPGWTQPGVSNSLYINSYYLAVSNNPEIIFIATWNECTEGNAILPSKEYGYRFLELHKALIESTVFE